MCRGPVWAGSERRGGERSEPSRSGDPAQSAANRAGDGKPNPEVLAGPIRRRFAGSDKLRVTREAESCRKPGEIGALLRREGLYSSHLDKWRKRLREGGEAALLD